MGSLRTLLGHHRLLAALLLALALAMKALVPAGTMPAPSARLLTVSICADMSGGAMVRQIAIPMSGKPADSRSTQGKGEATCPYASALGMAALGGADAPLLALALAFIVALVLLTSRAAPPSTRFHLRPPLRGPPVIS